MLVVLLLVAAFASGSETALTSVERLRVRHMAEENVAGSRSLDQLLRDPNQFLTTILILNMVTIIVASGVAVRLALDVFGDQVPEILVSLGFSVIVLIAAEIIPKSLAIRTAERTALHVAPLIAALAKLLAPPPLERRLLLEGELELGHRVVHPHGRPRRHERWMCGV